MQAPAIPAITQGINVMAKSNPQTLTAGLGASIPKPAKKATKKPSAKAPTAPAKAAPAAPAPKASPKPKPAPAAAHKPAPVAVTKAPKAPRAHDPNTYKSMAEHRNTKSTIESPVFAMWTLCNNMIGSRRKDVIAHAVGMGISYYTARTQYQLWLTAHRADQANAAKK